MLDTRNLGCSRGDRPLFSGLALSVQEGQLLHVRGSNGIGKTTLLRTLAGLSRPHAGTVRWRGTVIAALGDEYRTCMAYVGHHDGVQGEFSAAENLRASACLNGAESGAIDIALGRLGLDSLGNLPAKYFSQGQRRRLALARLLLLRRPLWILDEPFTALDTASCRLLERLLREHLATGGLIVLSSHQTFAFLEAKTQQLDLDAAPKTDADYVDRAPATVVPADTP